MERVLEPEVMDDLEQSIAYAKADFEEPNSHFLQLFQKHFVSFQNLSSQKILDLGCGPGDISIKFATTYPKSIVHAVDASKPMLDYGRKRVSELNLNSQLEFIEGKIPEVTFPYSFYDAIVSNSLLHHLHKPSVLWETIKKYGNTNAAVLIMDLKRPSSIEEAKNIVETYSGEEPEILKRDFYNSLLAAFKKDEIKQQLQEHNLDFLEIEEVSDRHILIFGNLAS